ncbi:MAG: YHS domain-containing protein [Chloroflexi bacterium]|nr:YHS domain-containing protein [Chloroflexota bacterium]
MSMKPASVIDPVCGMTVDVTAAETNGLTIELDGRTYAFCGSGCRQAFAADPGGYAALTAEGVPMSGGGPATGQTLTLAPVIDEGMRRWYENCSCCLNDAFPDVKAQLDAERAAAARPPVDPGICEVAEANQ